MIRKKYILKVALVSLSLLVAFFLTGFYEGSVGSDGAVLKQYLPPEKLKELVDKPDSSMWIIDVRPASAYQKGHIPTASYSPPPLYLPVWASCPRTNTSFCTARRGYAPIGS